MLNTLGIRVTALLNDISVWWHLIGVAVFVGFLVVLPDQHASAKFVFTDFQNNTGWSGPGSGIYVFFIGMLLAQYTITGFDASAHMTEETENAAVAGPKGMVTSVWLSGIAGYVLLLAVTFAIAPGFDTLTAAGSLITAPIPILLDAIGDDGTKILIGIACVAQFFCGNASLTANSRMLYAFSRDGAVPGHKLWHRINPRTRTPTNSIWICAVPRLPRRRALAARGGRLPGHVLRHRVDRGDRAVHRLHHPGVPAAAAGRELRAGAVAPRPVELRRSAGSR